MSYESAAVSLIIASEVVFTIIPGDCFAVALPFHCIRECH